MRVQQYVIASLLACLSFGFGAEQKTGTVVISGNHVVRAQFSGTRNKVVESPGKARIEIPAGRYQVVLYVGQKGKTEYQSSAIAVNVKPDQVTTVSAGAPLFGTANVQGGTDRWTFNYQVSDSSGNTYRELQRDFKNAPRLEIRHGGKVVHVDSFRYG